MFVNLPICLGTNSFSLNFSLLIFTLGATLENVRKTALGKRLGNFEETARMGNDKSENDKFDERKNGLIWRVHGHGAIGFALPLAPRYWFCPVPAAAAWRLFGVGGR